MIQATIKFRRFRQALEAVREIAIQIDIGLIKTAQTGESKRVYAVQQNIATSTNGRSYELDTVQAILDDFAESVPVAPGPDGSGQQLTPVFQILVDEESSIQVETVK